MGWAGLGWRVDAVPDLSVLSLTGTRHQALCTTPLPISHHPATAPGHGTTDRQELLFHLTLETTHAVCTHIITNNMNIVIICYVASTKFSKFKVIFTQNVGHAAAGRSARFLLLPISGVTRT